VTAPKAAGIGVTLLLAMAAFVYGMLAARTWLKASEMDIQHHWMEGSPHRLDAFEFSIPAIQKAVSDSAALNRRAADLTKWAVVFGTLASVAGTIVNLL
jgi:hypothetical protein